MDEGVPRDQPEVPVPAHEAAQQAVLELLGAPALRQRVTVPREQLFAERGHREDVEQGAVGVERERLDPLRALQHAAGRSGAVAPRVRKVVRERSGPRAAGLGGRRREPCAGHRQRARRRAHGLDELPATGVHGGS